MADYKHCGQEIAAAAAQTVGGPTFSQTQLRPELLEIAKRSFQASNSINAAIATAAPRRPSTTTGIRKPSLESVAIAAPRHSRESGNPAAHRPRHFAATTAYRRMDSRNRDNEVTTSDCTG